MAGSPSWGGGPDKGTPGSPWDAPYTTYRSTPPPPRRRRRWPWILAIVVLVVVAAVLGAGIGRAVLSHQPHVSVSVRPAAGSGSGTGSQSGGSASSGSPATFTDPSAAASNVASGLVDINVTLGYQNGEAAATGIVLSANGLVLTNNHVVDGATSISATDIGNGRTYKATVLGYDRSHDIALIQLSGASGLTTAPLGDSSGLATGDSIVAVGNAGGVGGAPRAAAGSVTSLGKTITAGSADGSSEQLSGLIEVNANVQPGDSGGPLVDTNGRVVGVDTAASAGMSFQSASSQGYAVPLNQAMAIVKQIQSGTSTATVHVGPTALLGVEVQSANGQFGGQGAAPQSGALVVGLLSGSPAESSGLQAGDTITAIGGRSVDSPNALTAQIQSHKPGDKVTLEWVDQSGRQHTADITLAAGPAA